MGLLPNLSFFALFITSVLSQSFSPTQTPTQNYTLSTTETASPSATSAIAGAFGGVGGILILLGGLKWYQQKVMTERRRKKQHMTARFVNEAQNIYGITPSSGITEPNIVMYTVANVPLRVNDANSLTSIKKGFAPKPAVK